MENRIGMSRLVIEKYSREDWNIYLELEEERKGGERSFSSDAFLSFLVTVEEKLPRNHGEGGSEFMKMHFEITTAGNFLGNEQEMSKRMCQKRSR